MLLDPANPEGWEWYWTLLLYLVGLGLLLLELIIPTGGLLGLAALGCVGYSLWVLYQIHLTAAIIGSVFLVAYCTWLVCWGAKRFTTFTTLAESSSVSPKLKLADKLVGEKGQALTDLRPAGSARIEGQKFDVVTTGDFVLAGTDVIVDQVIGNRIVVRPCS